ncbi:MAG: hypothetical protein AAGJ34_04130 [Pseudomonadota bacterium]
MIYKGEVACDPRGLIFEAYRIEGITQEDCRTIFFDWALGVPDGEDAAAHVATLLSHYGQAGHPMTSVLEEGLQVYHRAPKRRGGRKSRQ